MHIAANLITTHEKLAAFAAMACVQRTATTLAFGDRLAQSVASASRRHNLGTRTRSAIVILRVSPKQASSRPLVSAAKSPCAQLMLVIHAVIAWDGAAAYARGLGNRTKVLIVAAAATARGSRTKPPPRLYAARFSRRVLFSHPTALPYRPHTYFEKRFYF